MAHNSTIITIVTNCDVCNKPIEDDKDDFVQCDECEIEFHLKCINVSKAEAKARHNSKCLRLYCPDCMEKKENSTDEKLKTIMKMLYKLDVFNQEQKPQIAINNESISSLSSKLNVISSKLDSVSSSELLAPVQTAATAVTATITATTTTVQQVVQAVKQQIRMQVSQKKAM